MADGEPRGLTEEEALAFLARLNGEGRERLLNALARYLAEEERRAALIQKLRKI